MNKDVTKEVSKERNKERCKVVESIVFTALIVLVIPLIVPLSLKGFHAIVKTEFALAMSNVAKAWTFITQSIAIFFAVRYDMRCSFVIMICAPILLFLAEIVIYLLGLMPIW